MELEKIKFNRPYMTGKELYYIAEAKFRDILAGDGPFTKRCHQWLETETGSYKALLTHSCTAALEMAALLLDIQPGDEIIMPSYTFVSTANAFVLRGGVPVFLDIREDTLNIDEQRIEAAITARTKAIVPVHYAGVACEMDTIKSLAYQYKLRVVEDAAQGIMSYYKGQALGSIGDLGAFSFHETKNVISGEGGALLVNNSNLALRAEILREKGTDRSSFFRGEIDKYTWQDLGSSFLPGEIIAAFLWAQFEEANIITTQRLTIWEHYYTALTDLAMQEKIALPTIPNYCQHNAHMFYIIPHSEKHTKKILNELHRNEINALRHYVPLHSSPAGRRYGRMHDRLDITNKISSRLIRLPLWIGLTETQQNKIVEIIASQ